MRALTVFSVRTLAAYLAAAGQFALAHRLLEWGVRTWPGQADLWMAHGQILLRWASGPKAGRATADLLDAAADAYRHAEGLRPGLIEARRERGLALLRLAWLAGRPGGASPAPALLRDAVAEYDRVLEAHPRRADVRHERAMARAALRPWVPTAEGAGLLEQALEDLDASVRLRPHAGEAIFHRAEVSTELARIYHARGRRTDELRLRLQGVADLGRVRRLRPDWSLPLLLQAVEDTALARLGDAPRERLRSAIDNASTVLSAEPRNAQAALVRADARLAAACTFGISGDQRAGLVWKQAEADFQSAMAVVGLRNREEVLAGYAQAQAAWAEVLFRGGATAQAIELWHEALEGMERAVDDDPQDRERLLTRAGILLALAEREEQGAEERRQRALADAETVLETDPESAWALALRALARIEDPASTDSVLADARQARGRAPEDDRILAAERRVFLAAAQRASGDRRAELLHAVLENCAAALAVRRDDATAHLDQARALHLAGRATAAYAALEQALRLAPTLRNEARSDPVWTDVRHGEGFRRLIGDE